MAEFANWQWANLEETSSTNDEVKKFCDTALSGQRFMVTSNKQSAGRGRRGRDWISLEGNLFVSFGLEVSPQYLGQMSFVVGLSLLETIKNIASQINVCLKWPNDVLVDGKKVSGILLEKAAGNYLVIGVGVNIVAVPQDNNILYPVVSLSEVGVSIERIEFLQAFVQTFDYNLDRWKSEGFAPIRKNWLQYAKNLGAEITVNTEKEQKTGKFVGVDENGALLLETLSGTEKIYAGDIFYLKEKENK